jgi:hypothetical protein
MVPGGVTRGIGGRPCGSKGIAGVSVRPEPGGTREDRFPVPLPDARR